MGKPAWTEKVQRGMWLIVARSPTVMAAEMGDVFLGKEDSEAVRAASRYADYHWDATRKDDEDDSERGDSTGDGGGVEG